MKKDYKIAVAGTGYVDLSIATLGYKLIVLLLNLYVFILNIVLFLLKGGLLHEGTN